MNRMSLQALTWGTVCTAVGSALLLAASADDGALRSAGTVDGVTAAIGAGAPGAVRGSTPPVAQRDASAR